MILFTIGLIISLMSVIGINFLNTNFDFGIICAVLGIFMMQFGNKVLSSYAEENE